ncbi:MAG: amidohydrolase family protein [Planctomycetota bacterium]
MQKRCIEQAIMMSSISILQDFRQGNKLLFKEIARYDNLYGYCFINGNYIRESFEQMEMYLSLPKCKGIKYHPEYSARQPDDTEVITLFEKVSQSGKVALIHSWPYGEHGNPVPKSHPRFIANLAQLLPELKIIMGHMGGPQWREAIEIAKNHRNIYLDTGSSYTHFDKIKVAVDKLGAERVLFGSGMTEGSVDMQLGVIRESEITEKQKHVVLYEAARKLFGL